MTAHDDAAKVRNFVLSALKGQWMVNGSLVVGVGGFTIVIVGFVGIPYQIMLNQNNHQL